MGFNGQVAVVTGAAKGIGEATAKAFGREGASVALLDIDDAAANVARSIGSTAMFVRCDVGKSQQVDASFLKIKERFERLDILINNAGIQHYGTVTETPEEEWDRVMSVNLKSAYLCARRAIPLMMKNSKGV